MYRTRFLDDGTILCHLEGSDETYLEATSLEPAVLRLDAMRVAPDKRGRGISHELFREVLQAAGGIAVRVIEGWLSGTNAQIARSGMEQGLTNTEAAAQTPLGKTARKFGFVQIEYDAFIGLFRASS